MAFTTSGQETEWALFLQPRSPHGATFNDLDPSGNQISRSSAFSVVNSTEIALNIPHKAHIL